MAVANEELEFAHHLKFYERLDFFSGDPEKDAIWYRRAEYLHSLRVCDAVCDAHLAAVALGQRLTNSEARMQLIFGVGRRTKFIWISFRNLFLELIHPERNEPLPGDDVETAARDLNVIYINIRGTLDNFTWCLLELFGDSELRKLASLRPGMVNLFSAEFLKQADLAEVATSMQTFRDWSKELKARRDPAAHRIPLSIVPSLIDESTKDEYVRLYNEWSEVSNSAVKAVAEGQDGLALFERAEALHERLERVGKFHPLFGHDPSEGLMKIYPIVPQDIGRLVEIARVLTSLILDKLASRAAIVSILQQRAVVGP